MTSSKERIQPRALVVYQDAALPGLRTELRVLERKIHSLAATKAEYLHMIHTFKEEYNRRLGELVRKLVKLRAERLPKPPVQEGPYKDAHKETTGGSESFKRAYTHPVKEPFAKLSEQEREELKKNYRQAGRLCHPDTVDKSKKQQAEKTFQSLSVAYKKGDKKAVKKILDSLLSGECFASSSDIMNDKLLLDRKIENLRAERVQLEADIEKIENDD